MPEQMIISGNHAAAYACKAARVGVVAAYPITPQSPVVEKIAYFVEHGDIPDTQFIRVESEQSAIGAIIAASATGYRTFTASSANGLAFMNEQLAWAAGNRLPIVMCIATRALAAPWNVQTDHQDSMSVRDTGWLQLYCEDNQEIYDTVLQAYRIAENPSVFLPTFVCYDGYILSHTVMPVQVEDQDVVDEFMPPFNNHMHLADTSTPIGMSPVTTPNPILRPEATAPGYFEFRWAMQKAHERVLQTIQEVHAAFAEKFGRSYGNGIYKTYRAEDAGVLLLAMGSVACEARIAVDQLRAEGINAGVVSLKVFRPFPGEILREVVKDAKTIAVFDRGVAYGYEGVLSCELKAALYGAQTHPYIKGFIVGIGGRDIYPEHFIQGVKQAIAACDAGEPVTSGRTEWIGLHIDQLTNWEGRWNHGPND